MTKIPPKLRALLLADPFMQRSCLSGSSEKIQRHHALEYRGRQVNALFCLLPLTVSEHANANRPDIKRRLEKIMRERATEAEKREYAWFFKKFNGEIVCNRQ